MKTLLIPADPKLVIYDPATRKRVTMDGVRVDPRDPFWRRRLRERSMMIAPEAAPVVAPVFIDDARGTRVLSPAPLLPVTSED